MDAAPIIPLTVIGGYLGAGKTTLVNRLLRQANGRRLAVLVNEFGDLPIDADLIEARDGDMISIAGGCVCCSFGGDLVSGLIDLAALDPPPDHVLLEASGVALPRQIAQSVGLLAGYRLDAVVVLADAETLASQAVDAYVGDTIQAQLAAADLVLLNKTDLAGETARAAARARIAETAPNAVVIETERADTTPDVVLGLDATASRRAPTSGHDSRHDAVAFAVEKTVDIDGLADALAAAGLARAKGVLQDADGGYRTIQVVGRRAETSEGPDLEGRPGALACIRAGAPLREAEMRALVERFEA